MLPDRDFIAESGHGRGEGLTPSRKALGYTGERQEHEPGHEEDRDREHGRGREEAPPQRHLPHAVPLRSTAQVSHHERDRGQADVSHESDQEEDARPVRRRGQDQRERQGVEAQIVGCFERSERLGGHEEQEQVDHGDDHVVLDHEDVH
ncbi:MAG: hypothetical protein U5R14_15535 [Gemmatimonadota bacterium]|nr:hypothetical protein [Gemmatimonadota bacterium]